MNWIGVITGDIVNSTDILNSGHRGELLNTLNKTIEKINNCGYGPVNIEMYRGDSFQIIIENNLIALDIALIIRAALIINSKNKNKWDARLGLGVGKGEFIADSIAESDGEAFRLSGKAFDNLNKNERLSILTPHDDFNEELHVSTAFADDIVSNWTIAQAEAAFTYILDPRPQKEIAITLKKTPQTVNRLFMTGKIELISNFIDRFVFKSDDIISKLINP